MLLGNVNYIASFIIFKHIVLSFAEKGGRGKDPVQHSHDFFVISSCKVSAKFKERLDVPTSKGKRFLKTVKCWSVF